MSKTKKAPPKTFQDVAFHGVTLTEVKSKGWKHTIFQKMKEWNIPNPNYYAVEMKHHKNLSRLPYLMCPMYGDTPCYLYFTKTQQGNDISLLLTWKGKDLRMYICPFRVTSSSFDETMIVVDVVERTDGQLGLFAYDILLCEGKSYMMKKCGNVIDRIKHLNNFLQEKYTPDTSFEPIPMFMKHFYQLSELTDMVTKSDGCLATKMRKIVFYGGMEDSKQLRPFCVTLQTNVSHDQQVHCDEDESCKETFSLQSLEGTILQIQSEDEPDSYSLYHNDSNIGRACVRSLQMSLELRNHFESNPEGQTSVVCKFNKRFQKLEPTKIVSV